MRGKKKKEHKEERRELGSKQGLKDTLRSPLLAEEKGTVKCTKEGQSEKSELKIVTRFEIGGHHL